MTVLIVTERSLDTGGAQVMPATPCGYATAGHDVMYLSCGTHCRVDRTVRWRPGVLLIERRLPWGRLLSRLGSSRATLPVRNLVFLAVFCAVAVSEARRILGRLSPVDVLYGYEVFGVLAVRLVALFRRQRPLVVSRFQGTKLYPYVTDLPHKLMLFDHYLALKSPGDLCIMTNDGTYGDRVMRVLNPAFRGVHLLLNGLDRPEPADPRRVGELRRSVAGSRECVCMTVSRLAPWKRLDRAIDAIAALEAPRREQVVLVIIGEGVERVRLERRAAAAGLADFVTFVGAVPNSDVGAYLAVADVFLSLYDLSNLGNPLLEALRAGKAIVTLDNGGTGSVIRDGWNGILLLAGPGVPERVAGAIGRLMDDPELRRHLETNAAKYASEHVWTWKERMAREVALVEAAVRARG